MIFLAEKDELINLVVIYANNSQFHDTSNRKASEEPAFHSDCSNSFEQLRHTCTALFHNISDKIVSEVQQFNTASENSAARQSSDQMFDSNAPIAGPSGLQQHKSKALDNLSQTNSSTEEIGAIGGRTEEDDSCKIFTSSCEEKTQFSTKIMEPLWTFNNAQTPKQLVRRRSDSDLRKFSQDSLEVIMSVEEVRIVKRAYENSNIDDTINNYITILQRKMLSASENKKRFMLEDFLIFLEQQNINSACRTLEEIKQCNRKDTLHRVSPKIKTTCISMELPLPKVFCHSQRINLCDIDTVHDFDQLSVKVKKNCLISYKF